MVEDNTGFCARCDSDTSLVESENKALECGSCGSLNVYDSREEYEARSQFR